ncbi:hypothetical protein [Magnetovibrio sp.]|uniref:hypothetical protein n=1 Tax=Magnetovibrio sp. TaxID=2024836 RepID=UPI002F946CDD
MKKWLSMPNSLATRSPGGYVFASLYERGMKVRETPSKEPEFDRDDKGGKSQNCVKILPIDVGLNGFDCDEKRTISAVLVSNHQVSNA